MSTTLSTEIKCPHCEGAILIERPAPQRRGALAGVPLTEMDDDQLKIEIRNAKSVLYKAVKREAPEDTILANQARVEAAMAEKEARDAAKKAEEPVETTEDVAAEEADTSEEEAEY